MTNKTLLYSALLATGLVGFLFGKLLSPTPVFQSPAPDEDKSLRKFKEENIVKAIRENAKDIQRCYLTYLEKKKGPQEGAMRLLFKIEEDGEIAKLKITKDEFNDRAFKSCVLDEVKTFTFAPPPLGINRHITHQLEFKSEETALREAKEREANQAMPKVLPVK